MFLALPAACGGDPSTVVASDGGVPRSAWVDVGTAEGEDGLDFVALEPGGPVPLHTFGQGGTHALLAVRCSGFGNRAFISVKLTNVETGAEVSIPPTSSPRLLLCRDDEEGACDLLPLLVMTGGLVPAGMERAGAVVRVSAEASNTDGVMASVERDGILSGAEL